MHFLNFINLFPFNKAKMKHSNIKKITSYIEKALALIAEADIEEALKVISLSFDFLPSEDHEKIKKDYLLLKSRYSNLRKEIRRNLINLESRSRERDSICNHLIEILEDLKKAVTESPVQELTRLIEQTNEKNRELRTDIITRILKLSAESGQFGIIREKGNFCSFSLPNRPVTHPVWNKLNWKNDENRSFAKKLRLQRYWLEKHIFYQSCKLIVNLDADLKFEAGEHTLYRMKALLEFIKTNRDRVDIVDTSHQKKEYENLLILHDEDEEGLDFSFFAESTLPKDSGIEDTLISLEEDKILEKSDQFDKEFEEMLDGMDVYEARNRVIKKLEEKIANREEK